MTIKALKIEVPDGVRLQAEIDLPAEATALAVLAHPHPLYGGSMDAGLIDELFRALPGRGVGALRFNFRGVGSSTGSHDEGRSEQLDAAAALATARAEAGSDLPVFFCGWSFGADVSMAVGDEGHVGWIAVAPPLRLVDPTTMAAGSDARRTLLLVPEHDQYRPPAQAAEITAGWANTTLATIAGADHFVWGHAGVIADHVVAFATDCQG